MSARWGLPGGAISVTSKLSFRALHIQNSRFEGNKEDGFREQVYPDPAVKKEIDRNTVGEWEDLYGILPELHAVNGGA